jgi:hypothetical protein
MSLGSLRELAELWCIGGNRAPERDLHRCR